jgi:hypothetical protein
VLKWMYSNLPIDNNWRNFDGVHPYEFANYDAVLSAYCHGDIKVVDDQATVWFAGRMVIGLTRLCELNENDLHAKLPEWQERYGPGRIWVEEVCLYQCPSRQII